MKSKILLFALLACLPLTLLAQKKTEYLASNGITYHIGDTVKMGLGSDPQGNFRYIQKGGWSRAVFFESGKGTEQYNLDRSFGGLGATVKKIRVEKYHGADKVIFTVGLGTITNCDMYIEDAIATCEIADCKKKTDASMATAGTASAADELAKYKKLLDQGAISQKEYDAMKKKLLGL